jgi:hypothetical protein
MAVNLDNIFLTDETRNQKLKDVEQNRLGNPQLAENLDNIFMEEDQLTNVYTGSEPRIPIYNPEVGKSKYDKDLGLEDVPNINEFRAQQQSNGRAITYGILQAVTGAIGDIVASPGYISGAFEDIEEMEEGFSGFWLDMGNAIKEAGQAIAPIYMGEEAQKPFNPWNGEWWANAAAQFGPTIGMLATSFATSGATTPALARVLAKTGALGRGLKGADVAADVLKASKGYNILRNSNMALTSRVMESGMEAHESYKSIYNKLRIENLSLSPEDRKTDPELKKIAGDEAAKVWNRNMPLVLMDFLQFSALTKAFKPFEFSKATKLGRVGSGATNTAGQMATEAFEEGYQGIQQKEAERRAMDAAGHQVSSDHIMKRLGDYLQDPEIQSAMVQGALGGGVFQAIGSAFNKMSDRMEYSQLLRSMDSQYAAMKENNAYTFDVVYDAIYNEKSDLFAFDIERRRKKEGLTEEDKALLDKEEEYLNLVEDNYKKIWAREDIPDELKKVATGALTTLDTYGDRIAESTEILNKLLDNSEKELSSSNKEKADSIKQATVLRAKIKALKTLKPKSNTDYGVDRKSVTEELIQKYEEELKSLQIEDKVPDIRFSDPNIPIAAADIARLEVDLEVANQILSKVNNPETQEEVKRHQEEAVKAGENDARINSIKESTDVDELNTIRNSTELSIKERDIAIKRLSELETQELIMGEDLKELPISRESAPEDVKAFLLDRYRDKPALKQRELSAFNVTSVDQVLPKLSNETFKNLFFTEIEETNGRADRLKLGDEVAVKRFNEIAVGDTVEHIQDNIDIDVAYGTVISKPTNPAGKWRIKKGNKIIEVEPQEIRMPPEVEDPYSNETSEGRIDELTPDERQELLDFDQRVARDGRDLDPNDVPPGEMEFNEPDPIPDMSTESDEVTPELGPEPETTQEMDEATAKIIEEGKEIEESDKQSQLDDTLQAIAVKIYGGEALTNQELLIFEEYPVIEDYVGDGKEAELKKVRSQLANLKKKNTKTERTDKDIEAKKADIEKRRQEELDSNAYRIQSKIESYEGIDSAGNPTKVDIITFDDGSQRVRLYSINPETANYELISNDHHKFDTEAAKELSINKKLEVSGFDINEKFNKTSDNTFPVNSVSNKINAKYDAELAALEGKVKTKKPRKPRETAKVGSEPYKAEVKKVKDADVRALTFPPEEARKYGGDQAELAAINYLEWLESPETVAKDSVFTVSLGDRITKFRKPENIKKLDEALRYLKKYQERFKERDDPNHPRKRVPISSKELEIMVGYLPLKLSISDSIYTFLGDATSNYVDENNVLREGLSDGGIELRRSIVNLMVRNLTPTVKILEQSSFYEAHRRQAPLEDGKVPEKSLLSIRGIETNQDVLDNLRVMDHIGNYKTVGKADNYIDESLSRENADNVAAGQFILKVVDGKQNPQKIKLNVQRHNEESANVLMWLMEAAVIGPAITKDTEYAMKNNITPVDQFLRVVNSYQKSNASAIQLTPSEKELLNTMYKVVKETLPNPNILDLIKAFGHLAKHSVGKEVPNSLMELQTLRIYHGSATENRKKLYYNPMSTDVTSIVAGRQRFKDFLIAQKRWNVNQRYLGNTQYMNYVIDNRILNTDVADGRPFGYIREGDMVPGRPTDPQKIRKAIKRSIPSAYLDTKAYPKEDVSAEQEAKEIKETIKAAREISKPKTENRKTSTPEVNKQDRVEIKTDTMKTVEDSEATNKCKTPAPTKPKTRPVTPKRNSRPRRR